MSVVLYRKGNTHTIRGIKCEVGLFNHYEIEVQLKNGWYKSPKEAYGLLKDEKSNEEKKNESHKEKAQEVPKEEAVDKKRTTFKCDQCGKRITRYVDRIITNTLNKRFCLEDCRAEYENKIINELSVK